MQESELKLAEFYRPPESWAPVFMQGDVLESVPRTLIPLPGGFPQGGTVERSVSGEADYCRVRAMIISPTCNIRPEEDGLIQVARVKLLSVLPARGRESSRANMQKGRDHRRFLLPSHPPHEDQMVELTDVWSLRPAQINGLQRVLCLSDWGRSLLSDALYRAFARPIVDATVTDLRAYEGCLPGS